MATTTHTITNAFEDHYEILQLSPNADFETINRIYRVLVKRYHPDNRETGDERKFNEVVQAYRVLSDPEKRASYDAEYEQNHAAVDSIFEEASATDSFENDRLILERILSILYVARRRDPARGGMGVVHLERLLNCPAEHLEFHIWYLIEKSWVVRQSNGQLGITISGIDHIIEENALILRRDRMLPQGIAPPASDPDPKRRRLK